MSEFERTALMRLLGYDPETGVFRWKVDRYRRRCAGHVAGTVNAGGYVQITVNGKLYYAHRLAWLFVHGRWPKHGIDHLNRNKADNRIANLQDVLQAMNGQNVDWGKSPRAAKVRGVRFRYGRFYAAITINGKTTHLGVFDSPDDAHSAYLAAKVAAHPNSIEARHVRA